MPSQQPPPSPQSSPACGDGQAEDRPDNFSQIEEILRVRGTTVSELDETIRKAADRLVRGVPGERQQEVAADVINEVWLTITRWSKEKWQTYESPCQLQRLMWRLSHRQFVSLTRKWAAKKRSPSRFTKEPAHFEPVSSTPSPESEMLRKELEHEMRALIENNLDDVSRAIMYMSFGFGCPHRTDQQISDALNIPIGTVKSRKHRALQKLRLAIKVSTSPDDSSTSPVGNDSSAIRRAPGHSSTRA